MSFETVRGSNRRFANKIEEPMVAYLKDATQDKEPNKFGNHNLVLHLVDKEGSEFELVTVGTLNYLAKNILISRGEAEKPEALKQETVDQDVALLGYLVRISPSGSYKNKAGKDIRTFKIDVDKTKKLEDLKPEATEDIPF